MMCLMGLLLTGCSYIHDDMDEVIGDEGCRVSIRVGASDNVETKAGNDDNALEHEFINELCVFVVDGKGKIEQKLVTTDGSATPSDDALKTGDAYEWRSNEFVLPAGKKTIYAFANWSTVTEGQDNGDWKAIINKSVGGTLKDTDLEITIEDPAGKVDLTSETDKKFIPMSVKQEVNVTVDQTIRVELVRLVGRVNIQLKNAKASQVSVTSFTMGQFANKVALMPEGTAAEVKFNQSYSTSFKSLTINGGESKTFQFYVNETKNDTPFSIQLTADNKNYSATTTEATKAIPRNNILPLNLTISESDLNLIVTAYIAPIGGYPVQVYTSGDLTQAATYSVTLPEGCSFQVTGSLADGTQGTCVLDYVGTTDQNENIEIDAANKSMAYVTALLGLVAAERDITPLQVSFIDNNNDVRATCTLNVSTEALKDWGEGGYPITRSLVQWGEAPRWYEIVPMMRKNP